MYGSSSSCALEVVDAPLDLVEHHRIGALVVEHPGAQRLERGQALAAHVIRGVPRHLVGHLLQAGERRGEDHAGVVAQLVRKRPAVRELGALGRGLVAQHERDARVAERVDAGGDRQLGVAPERGQPFLVDPELLDRVERAGAPGELDHGLEPVDRLERGAAVLALDQPRDVLVEHLAAQAARDHVDSLLAVEQARDVRVVEEPLGAGEPERRAGDDHRLGRSAPSPSVARGTRARRTADGGLGGRPTRTRLSRGPRMRLRGRARLQLDGLARDRIPSGAQAGGPQAAEGVVERRHVALLGVVAGEADDRVVAEHVRGEALQRMLRADLDEDPRALVVQRAQPLHELHRRRDLAAEHVEHLLRRRRRPSDRARR